MPSNLISGNSVLIISPVLMSRILDAVVTLSILNILAMSYIFFKAPASGDTKAISPMLQFKIDSVTIILLSLL